MKAANRDSQIGRPGQRPDVSGARRRDAAGAGHAWRLCAVLGALIAAGCTARTELDFDTLGLVPAQEKLAEVPLGRYTVPIPIAVEHTNEPIRRRNRLQLDFELYALVAPAQSAHIADESSRHEGQLRDRVMRVCRNASLEDLQEPELGTLRARLTDAVQDQLGEQEIRQVLITHVVSQEI